MTIMTLENLADIAEDLKGKRIDVSETGFSAVGLVKDVKINEDSFRIRYIAGAKLSVFHLGGHWGWASAYWKSEDVLHVAVAMIGSADIYMNTP